MKNHWGEPDDEPLPDWMNPATYREGNQPKKSRQSLHEACVVALTKPAVPVIIVPPSEE